MDSSNAFFLIAHFEEKNTGLKTKIEKILNNVNEKNYCYYFFLKFALNIMNKLNKIFLSESCQIFPLNETLKDLIFSILNKFIKKEYITNSNNLSDIDYLDKITHKSVK